MANNTKKQKPGGFNPFPKMEEEVLEFWEKNKIFEKSVDREAENGEYVFYDGPPFATGLPHYGHLVASIMKDAVPRYWTMKGYRVERRWGWDCHGLPIENLAEKELGLEDKTDIEKYGVAKFNEYCSSIVLRYAEEWKKTIRRIGRWVDMENDYKTMDSNYTESIWWVIKSLWEKDLLYRGHKSMHMCPRCGTTLSNFEVTLGYKDIKDLSATAKFELVDEPGTYILAWTTTPWTLIGNVALAVGSNIDYALVEVADKNMSGSNPSEAGKTKLNPAMQKVIIAKNRIEEIFTKQGDEYKILEEFKGSALFGKSYQPLFDYFSKDENLENKENGWKVFTGDFVSTEDGTGVVHIAPAFGEDDLNLGKEYNLPWAQHVDGAGRFTKEVKDWSGEEVKPKDDVKATDKKIIEWLKENNKLFASDEYAHSYPHCWRCDTPLLNYATDSWFVRVTKFRDKLVAANQAVSWVPEHIKNGRFGKWLEQARDWAISRNRYWGAPLPVWLCDKCDEMKVIGSRAELKEFSGVEADDLHKQFVDEVTWDCKCGGKMKRIPEVLDCWFESGSMPYAQEHYPFENKEKFEAIFPAQFIAEGLDQTRGWFYSMIVLATALFDKSSYKNVIVNGIVLAEDGQKMSKRLNNYPDPSDLFEQYSVDALRYYLLSSPVLIAENLNFSEQGVLETLRKVEMLLWNVYKFYAMYAGDKEQISKPDSDNILDKWILSKLFKLIQEVEKQMDAYTIPKAVRPIGDFINDLSTWYIRRSRDRFKGSDEKDKEAALKTTAFVLSELCKTMSPFMPFLAEQVWQKVNNINFDEENRSVHLETWPELGDTDEEILNKMEEVGKLVELGLAKRDEHSIKVRQPLAKMEAENVGIELGKDYLELIKDEVNVKEVIVSKGSDNTSVKLDTELTAELKAEGIKREVVRFINALRKQAGMTINDEAIVYWVSDDSELSNIIEDQKEYIMKDTLTSVMNQEKKEDVEKTKEVKVNGISLYLGISKK